MSELKPVSFRQGRAFAPRLSPPRAPGRHHARFWTEDEDRVLRERYPEGGVPACQPHLPQHHATASAIYGRAMKLGLAKAGRAPQQVMGQVLPADFDDRLREAWAGIDPRKRGEVARLADEFDVPRHWISQRALKLGLTVTHRKEPRWTAAEDELMRRAPLHDPKRASDVFRAHGFRRSPTAIVVRAKRLSLSRRAARGTLSATAAARILGLDTKTVGAYCISGLYVADKRDDRRLPQQGGSAWDIRPADLRRFVIDNLDGIDLRKVDKVAFVDLLVSGGDA